jgi:hypothetical protein
MSSFPPNLLTFPLEIRHEIFHWLIFTPHTITVSLQTASNSFGPISNLSLTCHQLHAEITSWSPPQKGISPYHHPTPFGLLTPHTTIQFHLTLTRLNTTSPIKISKAPKNREEGAVLNLWREIMADLGTCEMDKIDREIRDRFDWYDSRLMKVLNGVYEGIIRDKGMEEVEIEGENRYWVITTCFWGLNLCEWEGPGMFDG